MVDHRRSPKEASMPHYLSNEELKRTSPAEIGSFRSPVPTQIVSNGEFNPLPQTRQQQRVEARIKDMADGLARNHGLSRRQFLAGSAGMAAAFLAMNEVFGPLFDVSPAEAQTPGVADQRAGALAGQFIIDDQTHFVRDDFKQEGLLGLAKYARENWNPALVGENTLARFKFDNYLKEIFVDSDTKVALLSGAPFDDPTWDLLTNDQLFPSKLGSYWRLDDQKLMYPFYEKIVKTGITTVCIHKGLLPLDYEKSWPAVWEYNTVWDVGKAAKDWPQVNFVIYHGALRAFLEKPDAALAEFEQTGRIKWATDLAEIPAKHGVSNVYGELGTSFANSAVANPRFAAAFVGTLIRGLGPDHVVWGSDSLWYGSPQWQIEAFRRLEIPPEMQKKYSFAPLGPADGIVKSAIFAGNSA